MLDDDFSVAGIGAGNHSKMDQMAVLAVARKYDSPEDIKKQDESGGTSTNLRGMIFLLPSPDDPLLKDSLFSL